MRPPVAVAVAAGPYGARMAHRTAKVVGAAAGALALVGAVFYLSAGSDVELNSAEQNVADLPTVIEFSIGAKDDGCVFDEARGGLVIEGLTLRSKETGVHELTFYVQRDNGDDILPGYVSTVVTFDDDSRSHTFDLVLPVTRDEYEAGYDECLWETNNER